MVSVQIRRKAIMFLLSWHLKKRLYKNLEDIYRWINHLVTDPKKRYGWFWKGELLTIENRLKIVYHFTRNTGNNPCTGVFVTTIYIFTKLQRMFIDYHLILTVGVWIQSIRSSVQHENIWNCDEFYYYRYLNE